MQSLPVEGLPPRVLPLGLELTELAEAFWAKVGWGGNTCPLPAWMHPREVEELLWWATRGEPDGNIIEIGQGWGGSTFALAKANEWYCGRHCRHDHLWSFDPYPGEWPCDTFRQSQVFRAIHGIDCAHTILGTSDLVCEVCGPGSVRLALIDGEHDTEWARRDMDNILPAMALGGIILLHDVWNSGDTPLDWMHNDDALPDGGPSLIYKEAAAGRFSGVEAVGRVLTLGILKCV